MLRCDQTTAEGVVKINSRVLDQSQLKRYDKTEKHLAVSLAQTSKGKTRESENFNIYGFITIWLTVNVSHLLSLPDMFNLIL